MALSETRFDQILTGYDGRYRPEADMRRPSSEVYMWFKKSKPPISTAFAPTPEMLAEAKANPNGWVYQIAGGFGPDDVVPPESIVGAYKVDENGNLTGDFQANPRYQASS